MAAEKDVDKFWKMETNKTVIMVKPGKGLKPRAIRKENPPSTSSFFPSDLRKSWETDDWCS